MINWFNMPAEGLSNGGEFEIKELTATENKVYETPGEVYNKVTVNVEGGGGSSDFSTAEVTIITASGKANTIIFPFVYDGEYSAVGATFNNEGTHTFTVPLYKGEGDATIASIEEINISVTGNIEYVEADGIFIITGDGSITIS